MGYLMIDGRGDEVGLWMTRWFCRRIISTSEVSRLTGGDAPATIKLVVVVVVVVIAGWRGYIRK